MKEFNVTEIHASVKYEFTRHCGHSEQILARLADDFIARYSPKQQPHPDFFKHDAALALNQLTLYADQCVQVMCKFDFLKVAAAVTAALTSAAFRIIDFLAKHLYHHLKAAPPAVQINPQPLCSACGKLRENERVRSLKEELDVIRGWEDEGTRARELVVRMGEKYEMQELLEEELESLQALNEEEIRKRLRKMQEDHDKRRQEMMVCLEELQRANERVTSYGRNMERRGHQVSGKFNLQDYVFQLGRHFYHNIAALDSKLKQLRHSLTAVQHSEAQTEEECLPLAQHQAILNEVNSQLAKVKNCLVESQKKMMEEGRKAEDRGQMMEILQVRLGELQMEREKERINEKIVQAQLNSTVIAQTSKIQALQATLRKLKSTRQKKDSELSQVTSELTEERNNMLQTVLESEHSLDSYGDRTIEKIINKNISLAKTHIVSRREWKESILINPKAFKHPAMQQQPHSIKDLLLQLTPDHTKFTICPQQSFNYIPSNHSSEHFSIYRHSQDQPKIQILDKDKFLRRQRKKLSRIDIGKIQFPKMPTIRNRQSLLGLQIERGGEKRKHELAGSQHATGERRNSKMEEKKQSFIFKDINNQMKERDSGMDSKKDGPQLHQYLRRLKAKKKRNLSQENSYEEREDIQSIRRSIDRGQDIRRTKNIQQRSLGAAQKELLFSVGENDLRAAAKLSFLRPEGSRCVLSLEEINFSTYFYSLVAKLHLSHPNTYDNLRRFMNSLLPGHSGDEQGNVRDSLSWLLVAHRKCKGGGSICHHLEAFLERVKHA